MSIYDKPEGFEKNLDDFIGADQEFVLLAMVDDGPIETKLGTATKTRLTVTTLEDPANVQEVTTLAGAVAQMFKQLEPGDLPAVVVKEHYATKHGNTGTALRARRRFEGTVPMPPTQPGDDPDGF